MLFVLFVPFQKLFVLEECKSFESISSFKRKIININIYLDLIKSFERLYLNGQVFVSILKLNLLLNYLHPNFYYYFIK